MYVAKKEFKAYKYGAFKKGDETPYKEAWAEAGLIEEGKPEPKKELETKPEPKKKKATK